jgi:hypothetical protein
VKSPEVKKAIVEVLYRLGDVFLRETTLASEVEIRIRKPLVSEAFQREIFAARQEGLVEMELDAFDEPMYRLTEKGRSAARSL